MMEPFDPGDLIDSARERMRMETEDERHEAVAKSLTDMPEKKRYRAAVLRASMEGLIDEAEFRRLIIGKPFLRRIQSWCPLGHVGFACEFHSYPADGECECGEYKHHVHCTHGYIIQTG